MLRFARKALGPAFAVNSPFLYAQKCKQQHAREYEEGGKVPKQSTFALSAKRRGKQTTMGRALPSAHTVDSYKRSKTYMSSSNANFFVVVVLWVCTVPNALQMPQKNKKTYKQPSG
ncbi:hypothetical protein TRVL_07813 [Trypanosoma vivax]|uniref:Uncharacterized protein n=1 Tax=Trypanosoma vivax (strain Y486) TaxID=1055687 RepID=G0TVS2_TRYVY|nr:hypothetical protein TRVL_07813 [Trypanosoma vivax]CCC48038.1 hypothetical protein, unlikely [Trypanosoma vivax Y486]